jgi:hypothetical protein
VTLDPTLRHYRSRLQAKLGPGCVTINAALDEATVWVTRETDPLTLRRIAWTHPALVIIVIDHLDRDGRHDHTKFVDAVNAGAAAYLIDPSRALLAVDVQHVGRCRKRNRLWRRSLR